MAGSEKTRRPLRVRIPLEPREFEAENQPLNFSSPEADLDQFVQPANCRHSSVYFETRKQTLIPAAFGIDEKQVENQYSVFVRSGYALSNWKSV